ncbi:MAG TPA: amine dehydrogenase large subunit [Steroidobacteraceae bacterium]|nr:amine dehydrogenase large subunit [Steroidobacteraceae bacterium]
MRAFSATTAASAILGALICRPLGAAQRFADPLPPETIPDVATLPAKYPTGWVFLDYASERIEIRNVGSDARTVKGDVQARDSTTLLVPDDRPEFYTADTVWSRYTRGTRTDYITVYDNRTLDPIGEIVLPGAKRALITAMQGMFEFTDHQHMGLVFNFTPASSVTVVDLLARKVLSSVDIPGCMLIFPSGERGFSTLCSSGTMLSVKLDAHGRAIGHAETKPFNHLGHNPLFTASTLIGGVRYFVTMRGDVQPIDMRSAYAKVLPGWPLVSAAEKAAHWRPSGWQLLASDGIRDLYVLMQSHAHEGTQKDAANEIWVYDVATRTRIRRLRLVRPGGSIALTHAKKPLLVVQAGDRLDVYDPATGALIRSLNLPGFHTRMLIQPVR